MGYGSRTRITGLKGGCSRNGQTGPYPMSAIAPMSPRDAQLAFDADLWSGEEFPTQTVV